MSRRQVESRTSFNLTAVMLPTKKAFCWSAAYLDPIVILAEVNTRMFKRLQLRLRIPFGIAKIL